MVVHFNPKPGPHHRLGPSSSKRWLKCPVSAVVDESEVQNVHTIRGNYLHGECAWYMGHGLPSFVDGLDGEHVSWCIREAEKYMTHEIFVEHYMESSVIPEFGGTIDLLDWDFDTKTVTVWDYKFGSGKVYAKDNPQLICYCILAREFLPLAEHFRGVIMQPKRRKTADFATFTIEQIEAQREQIIAAATSKHYEGGDHCRFCPLRKQCPEGQRFFNLVEFPVD